MIEGSADTSKNEDNCDETQKMDDSVTKEPPGLISVRPPDSRYGWIVVLASFLSHLIGLGYMYTFGVFIIPINKEFDDVGRGTVSWIGSITAGVALLSCGFVGSLTDRFGFRVVSFAGSILIVSGSLITSFIPILEPMFVTYGVLVGLGISMSFIPAIGAASQWFDKYRGIATGIAVAGSGVGNFSLPPIATVLIKKYGWRIALRLLSISTLLAFGASFLYRRRVPTNRKWEFAVFKERPFQLLFISGLFVGYGYLVPFVHIVPYASGKGISTFAAGFLLSMMGISSTVGRIILGFLADRYGRLLMLKISYLFMAIATCLWPLTNSYPLMSLFSCVFGFFGGGFISMIPAVTADYFGVIRLTSIIGLLYPSSAIGNVLGPVVAGFLYDSQGSYLIAAQIAGGSVLVGFIIILFMPRHNLQKTVEKQDSISLSEKTERRSSDEFSITELN